MDGGPNVKDEDVFLVKMSSVQFRSMLATQIVVDLVGDDMMDADQLNDAIDTVEKTIGSCRSGLVPRVKEVG